MEPAREQFYQRRIAALEEEVAELRLQNAELLKQNAKLAEQVVAYCKNTLDIMMPDGGYCFAPTHCLQDNSPTENVVAMYEVAKTYGVY